MIAVHLQIFESIAISLYIFKMKSVFHLQIFEQISLPLRMEHRSRGTILHPCFNSSQEVESQLGITISKFKWTIYPVVRKERFGARGPYALLNGEPVGANIRVSQPSGGNSFLPPKRHTSSSRQSCQSADQPPVQPQGKVIFEHLPDWGVRCSHFSNCCFCCSCS